MSNDNSTGAHDGYSGEPGTYILQDGESVAVDPETLKPLSPPEPEAEQATEKTKPAAKQAKTLPAANTTE